LLVLVKAMHKTAIVVPCYNEAKRLRIQEYLAYANGKENVHFIFVNDGSTDGTRDRLTELRESDPHVRILELDGNFGEAAALSTGKRVSHRPNRLFDFDKNGDALDLAALSDVNREKWGKGKDWTKIWWVWQKLDDRYGPTWYPRWRWVQHTRWRDEPRRRLSLDETVEDMSIAVGEDLFGFFREIGTTLNKERFAQVVFDGQTIDLPVAPLEISPAGPVRLEPIGNYREPLTAKSK